MDLQFEASEFGESISNLLNSTVTENVELNAFMLEDNQVWVTTGKSVGDKSPALLVAGPKVSGEPILGLYVFYKLTKDAFDQHLSVMSSSIALTMNFDKKNPLIRLEFERDFGIEPGNKSTRNHTRHAAHVQIHGESTGLGAIWALNGRTKKNDLKHLHIPVGGRRFRPSLEDFIEFLLIQNLIPALHGGGIHYLNQSRDKWLEKQLKAAVRSNPEVAINQLVTMGYKFTDRSPGI